MQKLIKNYAVILASGTGTRYSNDVPKQFVKIAGKTVLEHTIELFEKSRYIDDVIVVITPEYRNIAEEILLKNNYAKVIKLLNGGETRKESSCIGVNSIDEEEANVVIHDCARPFLSDRIIKDCIIALDKYQAVDVAIPSADTIIKVDEDIIESIPERKFLRRGQTPQCFKLSVIKKAHELSINDSNFTDDCGLIVKYGLGKVYVVEGDLENIKITYPTDIYLADRIFQVKNTTVPDRINLNNLKDSVIVVFGGTSGIGECMVNIAKSYGANVYAASSRNGCDIRDYEGIKHYLENVKIKSGKIDYIVNTAGILRLGKLSERSIDDIRNDVEINYMGSINVLKAGLSYLKETKGSFLLFTSSSYTRGRAMYSTYSSTKAGIVNLVQALSEEFCTEGIKINAVNPARTATPMREKAFGKEHPESLLNPELVAEVSLKTLLSDITGEVIDVRK